MRLFVAFDLSDAARQEARRRAEALRETLPPARWVDLAGAHLTLVFLGEVPESQLPALTERLAAAFAPHAPLPLRLAGGGTFPPGRSARVAWVGVEAGPELAAVQRAAAAACVEAVGHQPEKRPYHPHVTLARCPTPWPRPAAERFAAAFAGPVGEPWTAAHGTLFESRLSPKGARYTPVAELPLGGAA
ncbi:MAG TPA: RNA 2',3'-cyclic phosphodiesterase [Thermoanaerobaculia bacterium]|nr:RNA 2',3'-cyclic phosphodiesterase [Thermoanaerobaculia bacterium]